MNAYEDVMTSTRHSPLKNKKVQDNVLSKRPEDEGTLVIHQNLVKFKWL